MIMVLIIILTLWEKKHCPAYQVNRRFSQLNHGIRDTLYKRLRPLNRLTGQVRLRQP